MKKSVWIIISCVLIVGVHTLCGAESLLVPMQFPKTFSDLDFVTRQEFKEQDYNRYATLTPYDQWILEKADEGINEQIAADIDQSEQQSQQSQQTGNTNSGGQTQGTSTQQSSTITYGNGYCTNRQPGIPENQKIPFGSPVLHEHFIYCSPYANLDRGSGCRIHSGYDIGCTLESFGRPIFATADGVVTTIMPNRKNNSAGNYIIVDHGNGFQTWYLHLNQIHVTKGQQVKAGCQIATIGNTGGSLESIKGNTSATPHFDKDKSHLHYEIHYTGSLSSVTTGSGKTLAITHGWPNAKKYINTSIDPTQFICVYANFSTGYCGKTFPYQACPVYKTN